MTENVCQKRHTARQGGAERFHGTHDMLEKKDTYPRNGQNVSSAKSLNQSQIASRNGEGSAKKGN